MCARGSGRLLSIAIASLCSLAPAMAQTWSQLHGSSLGQNAAYAFDVGADQQLVVAGTDWDGIYWWGGWVLRTRPSGVLVWERTYATNTIDQLYGVRVTPDGGSIQVGTTGALAGHLAATDTYRDGWVMKLDRDGSVGWQKAFEAPSYSDAYDVLNQPDGSYLVFGDHTPGTTNFQSDGWLFALDPAGQVLWQRSYDGGGSEWFWKAQRTRDGGVVTAGVISPGAGYEDFWVVKFNRELEIQWQRSLGGSGQERAYGIDEGPDGSIYVGGITASFGAIGNDWLIAKLDGGGNLLWSRRLAGSRSGQQIYHSSLRGLAATADGGVVAVGSRPSSRPTGDAELWVSKLTSAGDVAWGRSYGGSAEDIGYAIDELYDRTLLIAGRSDTYANAWILRTDSNGAVVAGCGPSQSSVATASTPDLTIGTPVTAVLTPQVTSYEPAVTFPSSTTSSSTQCIGRPLEVSPIGSREPLRFLTSKVLAWEAAIENNATTFSLYRGALPSSMPASYGTCRGWAISGTVWNEAQSPTVGSGFTYLVSGKNAQGEGVLGYQSNGAARANVAPCP